MKKIIALTCLLSAFVFSAKAERALLERGVFCELV